MKKNSKQDKMGIITTGDPDGFDNTWLAALKVGDVTFYSDKSYVNRDSARRKARKIVALLTNKR